MKFKCQKPKLFEHFRNLRFQKKAQLSYNDFIVGILIFAVALTIFFKFSPSFEAYDNTEDLFRQGNVISDTLLTGGVPKNWNFSNVVILGLMDENLEIDNNKLKNFQNISYLETKTLFKVSYDYYLFFEDKNSKITPIKGICGIGWGGEGQSLAYYYSQEQDSFMIDEMQALGADIYYKKDNGNHTLTELLDNINNYDFILMEDPHLKKGDDRNILEKKEIIESYVLNGGELFMSEHIDLDMLNAEYRKDGENPAMVIKPDSYLNLDVGEEIEFKQKANVVDMGASNFNVLVNYSDGKSAVARWNFGDGLVYFFSDFDTVYKNGTIEGAVNDAIRLITGGNCNEKIDATELIKITRLVIYNSEPVKMVLYVWKY